MLKKILSLLLCTVMLLSLTVTTAFAAPASNVSISTDKTIVAIGETITVTLTNKAMTVSSFACGIAFDETELECTGITVKDLYDNSSKAYEVSQSSTTTEANNNGHVGLVWIGFSDKSYKAGTLAVVSFKVKEGATGEITVSSYEDSSGTNGVKSEEWEAGATVKTAEIQTKYTVTWKFQDGSSTLETDEFVTNGAAPDYNGTEPTKKSDSDYNYTFAGWATEPNKESGTLEASLPTVSGDVTYYAAFSKSSKTFIITYKSQDGSSIYSTVNNLSKGARPFYNGKAPEKSSDSDYTYTFAGWSTSKNQEKGTKVEDLPDVTQNMTYYAAFSKSPIGKYSVTWKSQDGSETYETDSQLLANATPKYDSLEPVKQADSDYTYTFAGWATEPNKESGTLEASLPKVTGNVTYYAAFSKTAITKYTVTWKSQDGTSTLETDSNLVAGVAPDYNGEEPTKKADSNYTYTFAGWATEPNKESGTLEANLPKVSASVTYYAAFSKKAIIKFSVTWKSQDGSETYETDKNLLSGATPKYDGAVPVKEADADYTYEFVGWATSKNQETGKAEANLPKVTKSVTYYAAFAKYSKTKFTVTWKSQDGTETYETDTDLEDGAVPEFNGAVPKKAADENYTYTFNGWSKNTNQEIGTKEAKLPAVTGNVVYYATFSKIPVPKYTVTWKSQDGETVYEIDANLLKGTAPKFDGSEPTKDADEDYTYTFAGWATEPNKESGNAEASLEKVSENAVYYAAFAKTAIPKYTVTWKSQDGKTTYETDGNLLDGAAPEFNGTEPVKASDAQYDYTFAGWATKENQETGSKAENLPKVTADVTYFAAFAKTPVPATPVESVSFDKTTITLKKGETATLVVTVAPDNATDKSVTFTTSNKDVATVDSTGKITAVKKGTAVITATSADGKKAECTITVEGANVLLIIIICAIAIILIILAILFFTKKKGKKA